MALNPPAKPDDPAAAPPPENGMDKADLKLVLNKSKKAPVNCAIGMSADAKNALVFMHVTRQPKALAADLLDAVPKARNTRWGTASVDPNADPKLVKFQLNKPLANMDRRLIKALKGTGYTKIEIAE